MKTLVITVLLLLGVPALANEGAHGPEQKMAPHGGILRDGASLMFELVKEGDAIKIYPLTHDGKPIDAKTVKIDAKMTSLTDAKKKKVAYELVPEGNVLVLKFEKGSSYRYALKVIAHFEGKENKANWQIELGTE